MNCIILTDEEIELVLKAVEDLLDSPNCSESDRKLANNLLHAIGE